LFSIVNNQEIFKIFIFTRMFRVFILKYIIVDFYSVYNYVFYSVS